MLALFKKSLLLVSLIIIAGTVIPVGIVSAAAGDACTPTNTKILGLPTWFKYLDAQEDETGRCAPSIEDSSDALPIGIAVLEVMLRLGGVVAVVMVFWAAFKFITSQGSSESAASARKTAINALIGLVIVIISTATVSFVGNGLLK